MTANLLKTVLFSFIVPGTIAVYIPWLLRGQFVAPISSQAPLRFLGFVMIISGLCGYVWCAWHFVSEGRGTPLPLDPPRDLVVRGPYRVVRNPMYVAVLTLIYGQAILFGSLPLAIYASAVWLCCHVFVLFYEEPTLTAMFGDSYRDYRRRVWRWIPTFPRRSNS